MKWPRQREETKALVSDSGQPKRVTLGEVSKERDLEQLRRIFATRYERAQRARWARCFFTPQFRAEMVECPMRGQRDRARERSGLATNLL